MSDFMDLSEVVSFVREDNLLLGTTTPIEEEGPLTVGENYLSIRLVNPEDGEDFLTLTLSHGALGKLLSYMTRHAEKLFDANIKGE